jgi:Flp pilus assembly protein TadG
VVIDNYLLADTRLPYFDQAQWFSGQIFAQGEVMMQWIRKKTRPAWKALRLVQDETGQAMIVVVFSIIALIAIIGLGVDLGVVYVEKVNLARAMDAAALAGAQELPTEEAAHARAMEYLKSNGYDPSNACIEIIGVSGDCSGSEADTVISINTISYRDGGEVNTANRITVEAQQQVRLSFLRVVGFDKIPVGASATAENIENLDIALVYDRSGSMQEDTRCYGCWVKSTGVAYPLPFADQCDPSEPLTFQGYKYISIEAEHYSRYETAADYHKDWTEFPKIWWAMQRESNRNASGPDARGAWMMVGPHSEASMHYPTLSDIVYPPNVLTTPRLDYDFTVPNGGTYYVWIRAQGGRSGWANALARRTIHVGLDGTALGTGYTSTYGPYNDGASSSYWRWTRVLQLNNLQANQGYTLNMWAGGPGFRLDKIVITNDPRTNLMDNNYPLDWDYPGVSDAGPVETHGRTGWACLGPSSNPSDPRFVPVDPNTDEMDDLYDDLQPIGAAKEAAAKFVRRLNYDLDQIAYISYSSNATIEEELYCIKHYGSCDDFEPVVDAIESTNPGGSTNIAQALWYGLLTLMSGEEPSPTGQGLPPAFSGRTHYGRPGAAHILVLMTDGQANMYPSLPSGYGNCYSDNLWPDQAGESTSQRRGRECVAWFAQQARNAGVVVYTIGLGASADHELLQYTAELTGGYYYVAPDAKDLDAIFEDLYERIFLRLID